MVGRGVGTVSINSWLHGPPSQGGKRLRHARDRHSTDRQRLVLEGFVYTLEEGEVGAGFSRCGSRCAHRSWSTQTWNTLLAVCV